MPDILSSLANQTGIDVASIHKLLGAILAFFKSQLKPETYSKLASAIPQADELVAAHQEQPGGLVSMASELASKFMNGSGQAGAAFLGNLMKSGVPVEDAANFLPGLFKVLSSHLPPEVLDQLKKSIPDLPGVDLGKILNQGTPQVGPAEAQAIPVEPAPGAPEAGTGSSSDFV
jgi:hypothetical protein